MRTTRPHTLLGAGSGAGGQPACTASAGDLGPCATRPLPRGPRWVRRASGLPGAGSVWRGGFLEPAGVAAPIPIPRAWAAAPWPGQLRGVLCKPSPEPSLESLLQPQGLFCKRGEPTLPGMLFIPAVLPWAGALWKVRGHAGHTQPCEEPLPPPGWSALPTPSSAPRPFLPRVMPGCSWSGGARTLLDMLLFDSRKNRMMLTIYTGAWF